MVWIHKDDGWKLQFPKKYHLISYLENEPSDVENWIRLEKIPEGAKKAGSDENSTDEE